MAFRQKIRESGDSGNEFGYGRATAVRQKDVKKGTLAREK